MAHLRNLTYLSVFAFISDDRFIDGVLEHLPQVRVMLVSEEVGRSTIPEARVRKRGKHQVAVGFVVSYVRDWMAGARGEREVWDCVEKALGVACV